MEFIIYIYNTYIHMRYVARVREAAAAGKYIYMYIYICIYIYILYIMSVSGLWEALETLPPLENIS